MDIKTTDVFSLSRAILPERQPKIKIHNCQPRKAGYKEIVGHKGCKKENHSSAIMLKHHLEFVQKERILFVVTNGKTEWASCSSTQIRIKGYKMSYCT